MLTTLLALVLDSESIGIVAAAAAVVGAASAWLIIPKRVDEMERRLERLEDDARDRSDRLIAVETKLDNVIQLLGEIRDESRAKQ